MIVDVPTLLDELCVRLDICLDPDARARISIAPPADIDSFEAAVLAAQGLDPLTMERRLRHDIRECIARYHIDG